MKRPRTYRFSELWTENQTDRLSQETRTDRPMLRRPGRPTGARFRRRATAMLNRIRALYAKGVSIEDIGAALGIPVPVLRAWAIEELP